MYKKPLTREEQKQLIIQKYFRLINFIKTVNPTFYQEKEGKL